MGKLPPCPPREPNGICHHCGAVAVPFGCFCPACYGGVLHPDGLPMVPGDPDDPRREFNAEADAYLADQQMPRFVGLAIEERAHHRSVRRHNELMNELDRKMNEEKQSQAKSKLSPADLASLPPDSFKRAFVLNIPAIEEFIASAKQAKKEPAP